VADVTAAILGIVPLAQPVMSLASGQSPSAPLLLPGDLRILLSSGWHHLASRLHHMAINAIEPAITTGSELHQQLNFPHALHCSVLTSKAPCCALPFHAVLCCPCQIWCEL